MPEYSSTTITPADGVKTPAMNGSTSGNYTLSALRDFILASKGSANGLASLDSNGKLPSAQLPDLADDVLVYASYASFPASGTAGKLYIAGDTNKIYRWDDSLGTPAYVYLKVDWTDLTDGSVTVKKAECDASGNTITSTYETKADANNLKDAINANSNRIANLEQKAGDYSIVQYRGTNAVPTGKAKYGLVKSIVGKTRAWNQLAKAMNATNWQFGGSTGSFSDGTATYTASGQYGCVRIFGDAKFNLFANHYYLISAEIKTTSATTSVKLALNWNGSVGESAVAVASSTSWQTVSFIVPFGATGYNDGLIQVFDARTGSWDAVQVRNAICRDVGLILNDWNTSDITTANIPLMVRQVPDLLKGDAYDAGSLVDTVVSGDKSVGVNWWNGQYEVGNIDNSTGQDTSSSSLYRSVGYTEVRGGQSYYWLSTYNSSHDGGAVYMYDSSKNFIKMIDDCRNLKIDTTPETAYIRFKILISYFANEQIALDSSSAKTTYHTYVEPQTLMLSAPVTLKSAGAVSEVLDVQTGKKTRPIGSVTYDGSDSTGWEYITSYGTAYRFDCSALVGKIGGGTTNDLLAGGDIGTADTEACGLHGGDGHLMIQILASKLNNTATVSALMTYFTSNNLIVNYQLATPDLDTDLGVVIDNTIQTEGGGTIDTIQTQTPVIDNCLDVGYLAV